MTMNYKKPTVTLTAIEDMIRTSGEGERLTNMIGDVTGTNLGYTNGADVFAQD